MTAAVTIQPSCARCNPTRWVHIFLHVLAPPADIAGDYTLTFTADSTCTTLPDAVRTRTYEASLAPGDFTWVGYPANVNTAFQVTPKGNAFPGGLNHFWLTVAGNYIAVVLGDHTDPGLTERITEDTYLAFNGWATVSVDPPVSTVSTRFEGWIDYCVNPNMGERYDCTPGPSATLRRCNSTNHQLTLTRR